MTPHLVRTPRQWAETCRECHGAGHVDRREQFSLWTPDEYRRMMPDEYAVPTLDAKHDVPKDAYVCVAHGGASIFEACREGVEIARIVARPVAFEFNGAAAVCRADGEPVAIAKEWWKRVYGKTYEQSMAER